jgi:hypothetical protein
MKVQTMSHHLPSLLLETLNFSLAKAFLRYALLQRTYQAMKKNLHDMPSERVAQEFGRHPAPLT